MFQGCKCGIIRESGITAIFLTYRGIRHETLIDTVDLGKAESFPNTWAMHYHPDIDDFYVTGRVIINGKAEYFRLHRLVMDTPDDMVVDHIHHNTLDNRKSYNLRNVTEDQNRQNLKMRNGRRGVKWHRGIKKWTVTLNLNKQMLSFGAYDKFQEAVEVSKKALAKYHPFSLESLYNTDDIDIVPHIQKKASKTCGIAGITWHEQSRKWRVRAVLNGKMEEMGRFKNLEDAEKKLNQHKGTKTLAN